MNSKKCWYLSQIKRNGLISDLFCQSYYCHKIVIMMTQDLAEEQLTAADDPALSSDIPTLDEARTAIQKLRHAWSRSGSRQLRSQGFGIGWGGSHRHFRVKMSAQYHDRSQPEYTVGGLASSAHPAATPMGPNELPPEPLKCAIYLVSADLRKLFLQIWSAGISQQLHDLLIFKCFDSPLSFRKGQRFSTIV